MEELAVIILAAGRSTRMKTTKSKLLLPIGGKPLIAHIITKIQNLQPSQVILVGNDNCKELKEAAANMNLTWVSAAPLGTGHAVQQAIPYILSKVKRVLIWVGDVPLLTNTTLNNFFANTALIELGLLTAKIINPTGFGRILRDNKNDVINIVEEKDASKEQRSIKEINSGIWLIPIKCLQILSTINNNNAQQEYLLTDLIAKAATKGINIKTTSAENAQEIQGINNMAQLAIAEKYYQTQIVNEFMLQGVYFANPNTVTIRGDIVIGKDVVIDVGVILEGQIIIKDGVNIGAYTIIKNSTLAANCKIRAHSIIEGASISEGCEVGPFARLRQDSILKKNSKVGNFVEIKKSTLGAGSKASHLSYIGDSDIGKDVNIGAGVITCNYDGDKKHVTKIADEAFIGSGSQLVAPVIIGTKATVGAGATILKDVPANSLAISYHPQKNIENEEEKINNKKSCNSKEKESL